MPESVKNLGSKTQASEFNLRPDTNRGGGGGPGVNVKRLAGFMGEQNVSQNRMVQSTHDEDKTETTPMDTKGSAIADPKLSSQKKQYSGDGRNSPYQISDHKSSVMIKTVSQDANAHAKYEYCIESPKLSVHSLENQQSKPFEVTITKIPPQELEIEDAAHEPPPIGRRSSAPFN